MIDCCAQVLQLTSRGSLAHRPRILSFARFPGLSSAPGHILATSCAGHIGEHERPPKLSELHQPLTGFDRPSVLRHHITIIDIQNVDHRNISGVTAALAVELVLAGDMFGELSFRAFTLACRAASPDLACSVADDPGGSTHRLVRLGRAPRVRARAEPLWFDAAFFPHLVDIAQRGEFLAGHLLDNQVPRSLSRRSPDTVIPPAAKAILTAVSRGSGVSGPIRSGSNDELKRDIARSHWVRARQLLQTKKAARSHALRPSIWCGEGWSRGPFRAHQGDIAVAVLKRNWRARVKSVLRGNCLGCGYRLELNWSNAGPNGRPRISSQVTSGLLRRRCLRAAEPCLETAVG